MKTGLKGMAVAHSLFAAVVGTVNALELPADALATVDRSRAAVIERIVTHFKDSFAAGQEQVVRETLKSLRADHLLAASLAPNLDGLVAAIKAADTGAGGEPITPKAIGDPAIDLVYTPVTPCRLFDTRISQNGLGALTPGTPRTYSATAPVAQQGGPGGCAAPAGTAVAMILISVVSPPGFGLLQGGAAGTGPFNNALILYQPGDQYGATVPMPVAVATGRFDLVAQFNGVEMAGDLLGYFKPPSAAVPRKQVFSYNLAPGAISAPITIPVLDTPILLQGVNLTPGDRGITQVSLLRCCTTPGTQMFLEWVGISSPVGAAIVTGFGSTAGDLITFVDYGHWVRIEVAGPDSIRVNNIAGPTPMFGTVTLTW